MRMATTLRKARSAATETQDQAPPVPVQSIGAWQLGW